MTHVTFAQMSHKTVLCGTLCAFFTPLLIIILLIYNLYSTQLTYVHLIIMTRKSRRSCCSPCPGSSNNMMRCLLLPLLLLSILATGQGLSDCERDYGLFLGAHGEELWATKSEVTHQGSDLTKLKTSTCSGGLLRFLALGCLSPG